MSHLYDTWSDGKKILSTEVMQEAANALGAVNNDGFYNLAPVHFLVYKRSASNIYVIDYGERLTSGGSSRATKYTADVTAVQAALDGLTAGRVWREKVVVLGNYLAPATITVNGYTSLEFRGIWQLANNSDCDMIEVASAATYVEISGGHLNGNKGNQASGHGIRFLGSTGCNSWIHDMSIQSVKEDAINVESVMTNALWISDNRIDNAGSEGLGLNAIGDSVIRGNQIGYSGINNINIGGGNNFIINNMCWNADVDGIYVGAEQNTLIANRCELNDRAGIYVPASTTDVQLIANRLYNNGQDVTYADKYQAGIFIGNNSTVTVENNVCFDDQTPATQEYGIYADGTGATGTVRGNRGTANGTAFFGLNGSGSGLIIKHNPSFVTENSGSVTMAAGLTTITIAHGLAGTPNGEISFTPNWDAGTIKVSAGAANLDVYFGNPPVGDSTLYWKAQYIP